MVSNRDIQEENLALLLTRAQVIKHGEGHTDLARWGLTPDMATEIGSLEHIQLERAADCAAPIFGFGALEDVIIQAVEGSAPIVTNRDQVDAAIEEDNCLLLLNRWASCSDSPIFSETILGMSGRLIACLRRATVGELKRASKRGVRLTSIVVRPQYFFHAGRNFSLGRAQRTNLAICNARSLAY